METQKKTKVEETENRKVLTSKDVEDILFYFSSSIFRQNTVDDILWDLARNCISQLGFVDCVIYLFDEQNEKLTQKAAFGPKNPNEFELLKPIQIRLGEGIVGSVAESGIAEIVDDTSLDPRYILDDQERFSEITVPIVDKGKLIGIIDSEHPEKGFFTTEHLQILIAIASLCANKIAKTLAEEQIRKQELELLEAKHKMVEYQLKSLKAQMNPHFIFNALNAIQHFITIDDKDSTLRYLSKFGKWIRMVLEYSSDQTIPLKDEISMLNYYLELEELRSDKKFTYRIDVNPNVRINEVRIPFLVILPYVENAVSTRLMRKKETGLLKIDFEQVQDHLLCSIEDDGIARNVVEEHESSRRLKYQALSLSHAVKRIELLNEHSQFRNEIKIIDLQNGEGRSSGTRITIKMPVHYN